LIKGKVFVRDLNSVVMNRRQYLLVGQLWVPEDTVLKSDHVFMVVGSEVRYEDADPTVGLQILLNSSEDVSAQTKKKHASQILPFTHTNKP
jgi:hypothetical protein